jgi:hypothetical protein
MSARVASSSTFQTLGPTAGVPYAPRVRGAPKIESTKVRDRHARVWTISVVPLERADDEDLRFWLAMSPEARVALMSECLLDGLKTRGVRELPRFRRVYRVTQRPAR